MSGAKRRTKYRKHVEAEMLEGLPEPEAGVEEVVQVVALKGGNMIEVEAASGMRALCLLPAKFRKLVWIKRGTFVIAAVSKNDYETTTGAKGRVKFTVAHILFKQQIKHLQEKGLWPKEFPTDESAVKTDANPSGDEGDDDSLDEMFVNPNRRNGAAQMIESDSDSSEGEEEEETFVTIDDATSDHEPEGVSKEAT